jgi:CheY-like chemotaxis protein
MEIVTMMGETFPKTITVEHRLEENLPSINADRNQVHQTLLNLCVNARDAMPSRGIISIRTRRLDRSALPDTFRAGHDAAYVCISVADTGMGMDEATKQRIYEPFFTTKERGKGTGLGLAVVYGIMQSHNGFIDVESAPGKGTTFHVYFPVASREEGLCSNVKSDVDEGPEGTEMILIIEDEEMLRELLRTTLEGKGYKVVCAVDGEEGLDVYRVHREEIALVLSDIGLPRLAGDEVFLTLKRMNPGVKVVLASGYLDPELKSRLLGVGASGIIQKPYVPSEILRRIREELDRPEY